MRTELKSSTVKSSSECQASHILDVLGPDFSLLKVVRILPLALIGARVGPECRETGFPVLSI